MELFYVAIEIWALLTLTIILSMIVMGASGLYREMEDRRRQEIDEDNYE